MSPWTPLLAYFNVTRRSSYLVRSGSERALNLFEQHLDRQNVEAAVINDQDRVALGTPDVQLL